MASSQIDVDQAAAMLKAALEKDAKEISRLCRHIFIAVVIFAMIFCFVLARLDAKIDRLEIVVETLRYR